MSDVHEFPFPDSIRRSLPVFLLLPLTLPPALVYMVISPQLVPADRAGVVLILRGQPPCRLAKWSCNDQFCSKSNGYEGVRGRFTSHGLRHGGWKRCLHGSSCILSSTTKFSRQTAHSVSLPSLAMTSSVTVTTGRLATTSFEAGGTLGCAEVP